MNQSITLVKPKVWLSFWLGLALLSVLFFSVFLSADESSDFRILNEKLCNSGQLNPDEFVLLSEFLAKSENIEISDPDALRDYLCGNCKNCVFPKDEKMLKKIFGVGTKVFHTIKADILRTVIKNSKRVQKFCKRVKNPDIGVNPKTGRVALKNPINSRDMIETSVLLEKIIP